ncbi:MAG: sugar phosphate isomerase/epimerase [Planctomycetia bacterium]|nr:sugar phosphate isomerase/epimerase [Planctomycetia bacterium]
MMTITGFADEIGPDLEEQIKILAEENIKFVELRGIWDTNVLKLSADQQAEAKGRLADAGIGISAIGSPIGKVRIDEDWPKHLDDFRVTMDQAEFFDTRYIRLFSYYPPEGKNIVDFRDEVMRRMAEKTALAEKRGIILLHENERGIYGETAERCIEMTRTVNSPSLRLIFDPANFVNDGIVPLDAWPVMRDEVVYFHIKDMKKGGEFVPAGEGDGDIAEILADAAKRGYEGFLSLEPHLAAGGQFGGFSGPENFKRASRGLKEILEKLGIQYE